MYQEIIVVFVVLFVRERVREGLGWKEGRREVRNQKEICVLIYAKVV
jgi:hypothetical protein